MSVLRLSVFAVLLAGAFCAQAQQSDEPVFIRTQTGLEVDATGKVVSVEMDPDLPQALRERAQVAIQSWKFAPVMQEGRAVGGKTYANVHLCLVPSGDAFNVAIDFVGNGPGEAATSRAPTFPPFPVDMIRGGGDSVKFDARLRYRIGTDGRAELQEAEFVDPDLQKRHGRKWWREVSQWLARRRFDPETIDGKPVATVMELPMSIEARKRTAGSNLRQELIKRRAETDACKAASGEAENRPVALDSPFVLVPQS